jgi:hypothetical protein
MKVEDYEERTVTISGWQVNLTSYRLGEEWHAKADNVSPGATLYRTTGASREEAVAKALQRAEEMLRRTQRREV